MLWWRERLRAGREGDDKGWDGWMASLTRWTWVWANTGRWWRTGKPGELQSMGSQRAGHDWATEQRTRAHSTCRRECLAFCFSGPKGRRKGLLGERQTHGWAWAYLLWGRPQWSLSAALPWLDTGRKTPCFIWVSTLPRFPWVLGAGQLLGVPEGRLRRGEKVRSGAIFTLPRQSVWPRGWIRRVQIRLINTTSPWLHWDTGYSCPKPWECVLIKGRLMWGFSLLNSLRKPGFSRRWFDTLCKHN